MNSHRLVLFISVVGLVLSCSSSQKKDSPVKTEATAATTPAEGNKNAKSQVVTGQEMELKLKKSAEVTVAANVVPGQSADVTAAAAKPHREIGPVTADKALGWLKNGNIRYMKGFLRKDGQSPADRQRLADGQHPHSIILSCSDSRVPPEIIFDQKLGEVFVVRNAGNNSDLGAIASIEYAIEHLGVNLIVVMGHESCGAVKAAFNSAPDSKNGSPYLDKVLNQVRSRFDPANKTASPGYIREGWDNTTAVGAELVKKSQIIRDAVDSGSVKIQTALYHLGGQVEWEKGSVTQ